uniref:Uncharacterized protein n=1 Tax=Setaria italica TaxID=4555 RepID=K3ZKW5_SETIT
MTPQNSVEISHNAHRPHFLLLSHKMKRSSSSSVDHSPSCFGVSCNLQPKYLAVSPLFLLR